MIVFNRDVFEGKPAPAPRGFTANADDYWDTPDDGDYLRRLALGYEQKGDLRRARAYHRAADVIDPPVADDPTFGALRDACNRHNAANAGMPNVCAVLDASDEPDAALVEARFSLETAQDRLAYVHYAMPYHGPALDAIARARAEIAHAMTALPGGES